MNDSPIQPGDRSASQPGNQPAQTLLSAIQPKTATSRLVLMGLFVALGVILSRFHLLVFGAKAFPIQHFINVLAGVILGPAPAVGVAFVIGLLRNLLGVGTLLAFPGGMIGALLAGVLYRRFGKIWAAVVGEVIGTGLIGALLAFPVAKFVMENDVIAWVYVVPFALSSVTGAIVAFVLLQALQRNR